MQARNSHQILGWDLETPTNFVVCYTKGGTGQAIRIANHYNIPVFDVGAYDTIDEVKIYLKDFLIRHNFIQVA